MSTNYEAPHYFNDYKIKCSFRLAIIKVVQRVVFLHEELMKLPSFPRKALEADLDLYKGGEMGKVILSYSSI
jgi:hypothetical protein